MTITVCGADIHYEQHGEGAPLLLLHGWGCDTTIWASVVRDLSPFRRVTVIDFPGHGQSSEPPEPWSVTEFAQMTAELIERLAMQGTDIIAHSHGGRVSLKLAATRPELIGKLVLTGCAGLVPKPSGTLSRRARVYKALRALADNGITRATLGEVRVEALRNILRQRFGSADYKALKTDRMRATFNRVIAQDLQPCLAQICASTLLIFGENDTATPVWMGKVMEKEIPDAGLIVMPGATHYAFLERYGEFLAIVKNFLKLT